MPNLTLFKYRSILIAGQHGAESLSHRTGPNQASNKGAEMADSDAIRIKGTIALPGYRVFLCLLASHGEIS